MRNIQAFVAAISAATLAGCAAVNPNPNVGLRSVNLMVSGGNCSGAMDILRAAADRGEPWAQLRLGWFAFTKRCPGVDLPKGIEWLTRAACYESTSSWERGSEMAVGPSGYFNARDSSKEAALTLVQANEVSGSRVRVYFWLGVASSLYEPGSQERVELDRRLSLLRQSMREEEVSEAGGLAICAKVRPTRSEK